MKDSMMFSSKERQIRLLLLAFILIPPSLVTCEKAFPPDVTGWNVGKVWFSDGRFKAELEVKQDLIWVIKGYNSDIERRRFQLVSRTESSMFFTECNRKSVVDRIEVNVRRRDVTMTFNDGKSSKTYGLTRSSKSDINGRNIGSVEVGCSYLISQVQPHAWKVELLDSTGAPLQDIDYVEEARDEWSVYLKRGGMRIQIDYWERKVLFKQRRKRHFAWIRNANFTSFSIWNEC